MDSVLGHCISSSNTNTTTTTTFMAVDATMSTLRMRAMPCKKRPRPMSWYKPPASPESPGSPRGFPSSPVSPEGFPTSPVSPGGFPTSPASPASPASSTASDDGLALGAFGPLGPSMVPSMAPSMAPLLWPGGVHPCAQLLLAHSLATTTTFSTHSPPRHDAVAAGAPYGGPAAATPQHARKQSDFSIERILRDAGPTRSDTSPSSPPASDHQDPADLRDDVPRGATTTTAHPEGHFEWLQCTRYRPPKLPRSRRRDGPAQRRLGRNPRIPFSPQQVAVLEGRFRRSHYLSSADVAELSAELELSETRVKIWFQNRRARERRDGDSRPTASPSLQSSNLPPLSVHAKAPTPSQLPRSPVSAFSTPRSQPKLNEIEDFSRSLDSTL